MRSFYKCLILIFFLLTLISCGKKSKLDRYPESDFPRNTQFTMNKVQDYNRFLKYKNREVILGGYVDGKVG